MRPRKNWMSCMMRSSPLHRGAEELRGATSASRRSTGVEGEGSSFRSRMEIPRVCPSAAAMHTGAPGISSGCSRHTEDVTA